MTRAGFRALATEILRFLAVGGLGYAVDAGLSNLLVYGLGSLPPLLHDHPVTAKVISTIASILVAWLGNRFWTYGGRTGGNRWRNFLLFWVVNGLGMLIAVLPLGVTWYLLGWRDQLSYNISTNLIGTALALVFRFFAYRTWVFTAAPTSETEPTAPVGAHP